MLSTTMWLLIIFLLLIIKYVFIMPMEDNRLFGMYAARDAVAMAATRGEIDQESEEYQFVIGEINFEIYYTKNNYNFGIFLNNLLFRPGEAKKKFDDMYKLIEQYDILSKSVKHTRNKFQKSMNFRLFVFNLLFIKPFYLLLSVALSIFETIEAVFKVGVRMIDLINSRKRIVKDMDNDYKLFRDEYSRRYS